MTVGIRAAREADAAAIRDLVRSQPRMNPTGLHWPNFVVAVEDGRVIGCGQLRPAGPGAVELGSLVVHRSRRGEGIAGRLITALLDGTRARVLVVSAASHAHHYLPFGFCRIGLRVAPGSVRVNYLIGQAASALRIVQGARPRRMAILERPPADPGPAAIAPRGGRS